MPPRKQKLIWSDLPRESEHTLGRRLTWLSAGAEYVIDHFDRHGSNQVYIASAPDQKGWPPHSKRTLQAAKDVCQAREDFLIVAGKKEARRMLTDDEILGIGESIPPTVLAPSPQPHELAMQGVGPTEILCPMTGELIERTNTDGLVGLWARLTEFNKRMKYAFTVVKDAFAAKVDTSPAAAKTQRVETLAHRVKVELSDITFDQPTLRSLMERFPVWAKEVMKVETIKVSMVEYNKLAKTKSDDPERQEFIDALVRACKGRTGSPQITIER